ncbi:MAG: hypothetical protein DLM50_05610 [Candidatus Meridianibacter frigidus]|nr:MAG: hypothetical protein DLM50_05610 [Candidatus Eremiobacteraeota bacterium]
MVGTPAPSTAGKSLAQATAREVAQSGVCGLSGLALGIDEAAHVGEPLEGRAGMTLGVFGWRP